MFKRKLYFRENCQRIRKYLIGKKSLSLVKFGKDLNRKDMIGENWKRKDSSERVEMERVRLERFRLERFCLVTI